jgi:hypothetical protein
MSIASATTGLLRPFVSGWANEKFEHRKEKRATISAAAESIAVPLWRLVAMTRDSYGAFAYDNPEWCDAFRAFWSAWEQHSYALPMAWTNIGQGVRLALGEAVGPAMFSDLQPELRGEALIEHDAKWLDLVGSCYWYAATRLNRLRDDPSARIVRKFQPWSFDAWLGATGMFPQHANKTGRHPFG